MKIKNLLSVISCIMVMSIGLSAAAASSASDMAAELKSLGVNTEYESELTVTREEAVKAVISMAGIAPEESEGVSFTDTKSEYVEAAHKAGIVIGYGNGEFHPDDAVTYEEAVIMLIRALGYEPMARHVGGYIRNAGKIGLSKGISCEAHQAINADQMNTLLYNALDIDRLVAVHETDSLEGSEYTSVEGLTFRSELTNQESAD